MAKYNYSWLPDSLDFKDHQYSLKKSTVRKLPAKADLSSNFSIVHNQGTVGSCVFNASTVSFDFTRLKEGLAPIFPSRLFGYWNTRLLEGTVGTDGGCQIRDAMKVLSSTGICREVLWDYNTKPHHLYMKPVDACYVDAKNHLLKEYISLDNSNINELKACLADGYTFVFGFAVYDSFESDIVAQTGLMPIPNYQNENCLGGHAVLAVGFEDSINCFKVRNSWGIGWGDKGHFYMPYEYITNTRLCDDFWTMRVC